jgi:threonine/homoserine/homoserine lactone efflux protein
VALAGSPGPNTLSLTAASAAFGPRRVAGYFFGLLAGMVVVMAVVASGLVGLLLALPGVSPFVTAAAALYFVYLAWRIASAPPLGDSAGQGKPPSFVAGVMLSLVNPKGYAAMAALFSGFVLVRERIAVDAVAKIVVLVVVIAAVNLVWLQMGALLTRFFREPRTSRVINVSFAILLLASVALAVMAA